MFNGQVERDVIRWIVGKYLYPVQSLNDHKIVSMFARNFPEISLNSRITYTYLSN